MESTQLNSWNVWPLWGRSRCYGGGSNFEKIQEKEADEMADLIFPTNENSKKFVSYEKAVDSISPDKS